MDERYEILGKIGQGGIGAVYRAFDTRMNREVAIKRIIPEGTDTAHQDEAAKQMTKEAGALAALQHPHIVTIYDVGVDRDGPFVVMELLTGKSLDEVVGGAPLTMDDFRQVAVQTQEALIAAQDLFLVHLDIKPGNLVLTWLPSGKFQVKIVDFGLAKFASQPSRQTLDQQDSVYGSIFFMAPEQFERGLVDGRTDLYAMGCVYYFALTGTYPFVGDTGPQVMASHLNHVVRPISQLRPDLPSWLCDWVMWHINRQPTDRPADARESLQVFLRNDGAGAKMPPRPQARPGAPMRPGFVPPAPTQAAVPQSLQPPEGSRPSVHTTSQVLTSPPVTAQMTTRVPTVPPKPGATPHKKKGSKTSKIIMAVTLGAVVVAVGMKLQADNRRVEQERALQALVDKASEPGAESIEVSGAQLRMLLNSLLEPKQLGQHGPTMRALRLARPADSTEIDVEIAKFAVSPTLNKDVRQMLLYDVVRRRDRREGATVLIDYARTTEDASSGEAALIALTDAVTDVDFGSLLETLESARSPQVRRAAADVAKAIAKRSTNRAALRAQIKELNPGGSDEVRALMLGIKTATSGE